MSRNFSRPFAIGLAGLWSITASHAVVIGFDNMGGQDGDVYAGHTEKGFTLTPIYGDWYKVYALGNPKPCLGDGPTDYDHSLQVVRSDGGLFTSQSYDKRSRVLATYCIFDGFRDGKQLYSDVTWEFQNGFRTITNHHLEQIDELHITLELTVGGETIALDNIVVTPVPEPSGMALLTLGLGATFLNHRKPQRLFTKR